MIDTIKDLALLTTIQEKYLRKLITKLIYIVSDSVDEANKSGKDVVDLDIGIGKLYIKLESDNIQYKFIPSQELEDAVKSTVLNEQNLLEDVLETSLIDKITNIYKDLF